MKAHVTSDKFESFVIALDNMSRLACKVLSSQSVDEATQSTLAQLAWGGQHMLAHYHGLELICKLHPQAQQLWENYCKEYPKFANVISDVEDQTHVCNELMQAINEGNVAEKRTLYSVLCRYHNLIHNFVRESAQH